MSLSTLKKAAFLSRLASLRIGYNFVLMSSRLLSGNHHILYVVEDFGRWIVRTP